MEKKQILFLLSHILLDDPEIIDLTRSKNVFVTQQLFQPMKRLTDEETSMRWLTVLVSKPKKVEWKFDKYFLMVQRASNLPLFNIAVLIQVSGLT